jgi:plasmid stabilization system protein ParE
MPRLIITQSAKDDIQGSFEWWRDQRSAQQAERWFRGIYKAIRTLRTNADRCGWAAETDLLPEGLRQLLFGVSNRPTHRIVFTLDDDVVTVLRVRHTAQDYLSQDDLT